MAEVAYHLKATLRHTRPPVWREILVPAGLSLLQLHRVLQVTMGWHDKQLHQFVVQGRYYGMPGSDNLYEMFDEGQAKLSDALAQPGDAIRYRYDFNDKWEIEITLKKIASINQPASHAVCLAGSRAGPPENCGGAPGYDKLLNALQNPNDPRNQAIIKTGTNFNPDRFDIFLINQQLNR